MIFNILNHFLLFFKAATEDTTIIRIQSNPGTGDPSGGPTAGEG